MTSAIDLPTGAVVEIGIPKVPTLEMGAPAPTAVAVLPTQGIRGRVGPSGQNTQVIGEVPDGVQDGTNLTFTTANPFQQNSVALYRNGLREQNNLSYTENTPNILAFTTAPLPDDDITVDYLIH